MSTILAPLRAIGVLLIAVVMAFLSGLVAALILGAKSLVDGRISLAEQASIEKATWTLAWAALRKMPGVTVDARRTGDGWDTIVTGTVDGYPPPLDKL